MSGLGANRISPGQITRNTARTRHGDYPCLGACVSMSLTTYNLLLVQKKQTRHPHSLLMSHVSLCLLEVVFGDIETFETGFTEHGPASSDDATNARPRSNAPATSSQILIFVGVSSPKEATSPKGRGAPTWPKSNLAALSGKGHEAIFEFHASPLPGGSPRRRIFLALLRPTPGDSTRAATRWCERIRGRFYSRRPDWISALSGSFQ